MSHAFCGDSTDDIPIWFHRAAGGYVERLFSQDHAKYFGKQHNDKGGISDDLGKWLDRYEISADLPVRGAGDIGYNVYQAGLILAFCMRGGNEEATAALQEVTKAFATRKNARAAIEKLQTVLGEQGADLQEYLEIVIG